MARHTMAQDRERARLAGASRLDARTERMRSRLAAAQTPEAALNAAFDWVRSSAGRLAKRGMSRAGAYPSRPAAERVMREVTAYLAGVAADIDGGVYDAQ